jgi:hypothetical protein
MDWWKSPVLQGPENDYGQYDYMIEEIPEDEVKWEFTNYKKKCDSCGKERNLYIYSTYHFHTLDGYDYLWNYECWRCVLARKVHSIKRRIVKRIKIFKMAVELYTTISNKSFKHYYELASKIVK